MQLGHEERHVAVAALHSRPAPPLWRDGGSGRGGGQAPRIVAAAAALQLNAAEVGSGLCSR
jgi:hypothetical protein